MSRHRGGFAQGFGCTLLTFAAGSCVSPPAPPPPQAVPTVARPAEPARARGFSYQGALSQGGLVLGTAPAGSAALTLDGAAIPLSRDGRFLIGFGRDHGPSALLEARLADGTIVRDALTVAKRDWLIEALPIPRGTSSDPDFLRIRNAEYAQINAARRIAVDSDGWQQRFLWPVTGRISGAFGSQRVYNGEQGVPHSGVDIAEAAGTPVAAPADGVVILAADRPFTLEGNLLMIGHGMGLDSQFLHLSRIDVKVGDRITRGQIVGAVGMTGRATGPHLHWGMKWRDQRLDPALAAGPMGGADKRTRQPRVRTGFACRGQPDLLRLGRASARPWGDLHVSRLKTLFDVSPTIDRVSLAKRFGRDSRLQIPDILTPEAAATIAGILETQTPWGLAWTAVGLKPESIRAEALRTLAPAVRTQMGDQVASSVRAGKFAFVYSQYPMVEAYLNKWAPGSPLELLLEHVNDTALMDLVREVTGIPELIKADAQATLFGPGHFLASHDDSETGDGRRVAYVFSFARDWLPDWGGYLLFYDEDGDVVSGFKPRFNTLNLFAVPQKHSVSYVPPFAPIGRFSITGWFRDK